MSLDLIRAFEPALADELHRRVERGATLLDRVCPGWFQRIALDQLAMESCDRCILGQLHGDYVSGSRRVVEPLSASKLFSSAYHGFTLREDEQRIEDPYATVPEVILRRFGALSDLWRDQVRARLDGGTP